MRVAAIYKRVSTDDQIDGESLESQEAICRADATRQQWPIFKVYADEGRSGRKEDRPALQQMLSDARASLFDVVLVYKLDRLARNTRLQLQIAEELERLGVLLRSVTEPMAFTGSAGRLTLSTIAGAAQFFSDVQSERVSDALSHKAARGGFIGRIPLGYDRDPETGRLIPNDQAPVIEAMHRLYASGQYAQDDLAAELNRQGYRSRNAHGEPSPFTSASLRTMLGNRVYLGYVRHKGQKYRGLHEPLITPELYDAVIAIRESRARWYGSCIRHSDDTYLLAGLTHCAACGGKMHVQTAKTVTLADGSQRTYRYYRCHAGRTDLCVAPSINADQVDRQLLDWLQRFRVPDDLHTEIRRAMQQQLQQTPARIRPHIDFEGRFERLYTLFVEGDLTREAYLQRRDELRRLQEDYQREQPRPEQRVVIEQRALHVLQHLGTHLAAAPPNEVRPVLRSLFEGVWLGERRVVGVTARAGMYEALQVLERWSVESLTQL